MPLRVAFISGHYDPKLCGIADYTESLRHALHSSGIDTFVLTSSNSARACSDPSVEGVVAAWNIRGVADVARRIAQKRPEIVHVQYSRGISCRFERHPAILALPLALRLVRSTARLVTTVHEDYQLPEAEWTSPWLPRGLERALKRCGRRVQLLDPESAFLLPASDLILTTTILNERGVRRRLPWLGPRIRHIPIGSNIPRLSIDRASAAERVRRAHQWRRDAFVIASFGFLSGDRDLSLMLQALRRVVDTRPGTRLVVVGGLQSIREQGDSATRRIDELHSRIARLGLADHVAVTGYLSASEVSEHLAGSDMGVLAFRSGTTCKSGSLMALMAHDLPTVATRHAPPDPELEATCAVRLVPTDDTQRLAAECVRIIDEPLVRSNMRAACRLFATKFAWPVVAKRHVEAYHALQVVKRHVSHEREVSVRRTPWLTGKPAWVTPCRNARRVP